MRIEKLQEYDAEWNADGCLIENPVDIFYLTGLKVSLGLLIVLQNDARLFVDGRYKEAASKCPVPSSPLEKEAVVQFAGGKKLAVDASFTTLEQFGKLERWGLQLKPHAHPMKSVRLCKDRGELTALRKSAALLWRSFQYLLGEVKEGITEKELARKLILYTIENGSEELAFDPIIAFGPHTALPHYHPGDRKLAKGDLILFDIGVTVESYRSDMTRTQFFGDPDPELERLYTINKKAQRAALSLAKPGEKVGKLDEAAREVMRSEGVEGLFVHSLGHGIGLETHEYPRLKFDSVDKDLILEKGMVFTVEPGLYLPGKGGVRYEDTIAITDSGFENFYPEEYP